MKKNILLRYISTYLDVCTTVEDVFHSSQKKCCLIIETCMRLHNKAISEKIPLQQGGAIVVQHIALYYNGAAPQSARELRQQIAARF